MISFPWKPLASGAFLGTDTQKGDVKEKDLMFENIDKAAAYSIRMSLWSQGRTESGSKSQPLGGAVWVLLTLSSAMGGHVPNQDTPSADLLLGALNRNSSFHS